MAMVVALTSGKGGVGKSTTVVNTSYERHRRGNDVLVVDTDHGLSVYNFKRKDRVGDFPDVVRENVPEMLKEIIDEESHRDYIIIDLKAEMDSMATTVFELADLVLLPIQFNTDTTRRTISAYDTVQKTANARGGLPVVALVSVMNASNSVLAKSIKPFIEDGYVMMDADLPYTRQIQNAWAAGLTAGEHIKSERGDPWKLKKGYNDLCTQIIEINNQLEEVKCK